MASDFDSFDQSPLGDFVQSPLGDRNEVGRGADVLFYRIGTTAAPLYTAMGLSFASSIDESNGEEFIKDTRLIHWLNFDAIFVPAWLPYAQSAEWNGRLCLWFSGTNGIIPAGYNQTLAFSGMQLVGSGHGAFEYPQGTSPTVPHALTSGQAAILHGQTARVNGGQALCNHVSLGFPIIAASGKYVLAGDVDMFEVPTLVEFNSQFLRNLWPG